MALMAVLEVIIVWSLMKWFGEQAAWIEGVLHVLSVVIILMKIGRAHV